MEKSQSRKTSKRQWHYKPELPLRVSPLFEWPLNVINALLWIVRSWLPVSERLILVGFACLSWFYATPALEQCVNLEVGWIAEIYARNLFLMILVAGGLHAYFYIYMRQGQEKRYDSRELIKSSRLFTFNSQVLDNMFWTLASGVTVWTAYEVLMMWAFANGHLSILNWADNPVWFIAIFLLIPAWESCYFYLIHRALHFPFLYKTVHYLHHRNTNVGPWSGLSMHPIEHIIYLGTVVIHWLIASHPLHMIYHLQYFTLTAATTHTGFEGVASKGKTWLKLGTYHHQMHHRYFECNYGGLEMPWDKWFGSFHDGTTESHDAMKQRRKTLVAAR